MKPSVHHYTEDELMAMDMDDLDELAFGCRSGQVLTLRHEQLVVIYPGDLDNPIYRYKQEGMDWARSVDLSDPIEVSVNDKGQFCIEDGHHRWFAARLRGESLSAHIEIKGNPVRAILRRQQESTAALASKPRL